MTADDAGMDQAKRMFRAPLVLAGAIVDACTEGATVYWSFWGPLGEPAIAAVEMAAEAQRRYLAWLDEALHRFGPGRY